MGLDMYLERRLSKDEICENENVFYWRKANQINAWFDKNVGNGEIENCKNYTVTREQLEQLINDCETVLKDHSTAANILPTSQGFFFGTTDYDDWYFKDLEDTAKGLKEILKNCTDKEFIYSIWY